MEGIIGTVKRDYCNYQCIHLEWMIEVGSNWAFYIFVMLNSFLSRGSLECCNQESHDQDLVYLLLSIKVLIHKNSQIHLGELKISSLVGLKQQKYHYGK